MNKYSKLKLLKKANSICLIAHKEPDTDAIASMVVFRDFLINKLKVKKVDIFASCSSTPKDCLPILNDIKLNPYPSKYTFAIMMDCPNPTIERLDKYQELYTKANKRFVIDHHTTNAFAGDYNIVEVTSSTCEIVFNICKAFHYKLSKQNLGKIYAGIITDTNNFSVGAYSSSTFKIAAQCVDKIKKEAIYLLFFSSNTFRNMKLLSLAIENAKPYNDGKYIISHVTKEEAIERNLSQEDYLGVINRLSTTAGSRIVCFIYPRGNEYYVSMRAKIGYNCAIIAQKFNGGGHTGAAAFMSDLPLNEIEENVLKEFQLQNSVEQNENIFD